MTRMLAASCGLAGLCAVAMAAAQTAPQQRPAQQGSGLVPTQRLSGCLKLGTTSGGFVLADATEIGPGSEGGAVGTVGSTAPKKTYALTGIVPPGVKLNSHVNHKVEVAGTISESSQEGKGPTMNMNAFKHVAGTCP